MKIGIISELTHEKKYSSNVLEKILNRFNIPSRHIQEENFELFCIRHGKNKKIVENCTCINSVTDCEILYNIEVTALEIPYCFSEFGAVSDILLKKYMYSAIRKFRELGVEKFVFTDGIKKIYATEALSKRMLGTEFSLSVVCNICELMKRLSLKCGINPLKTQMGIVCSKYSSKLYDVLKLLVFETESIRIYTNAVNEFSYVCEELYNIFGAIVEVYEYKPIEKISDFIVCDFDNGVLRFGRDIVITDIKYHLSMPRYDVKDIEILDLIHEKADNFGIKYCICGKNRLTI